MLHKSEVKEWLNHPVTKAFQESLRKECDASHLKMMGEIENLHFETAQDLQNRVIEYNAAHYVYECYSNKDAADTILKMMINNGQLEEEEEPNDTH